MSNVVWTVDRSADTSTTVLIERHRDTAWADQFDVVVYNMSFSWVVDPQWIERIVHVVVRAVVHRGEHVPDLVRQAVGRLPFEIVLRLVVQEDRQDRHPGADRDLECAGLELVEEAPAGAAANGSRASTTPIGSATSRTPRRRRSRSVTREVRAP